MKAIINAKILCPVQGVIENGTILFEKGKIVDVGKSIPVQKGTKNQPASIQCSKAEYEKQKALISAIPAVLAEPAAAEVPELIRVRLAALAYA